jgi:hypothetical protein
LVFEEKDYLGLIIKAMLSAKTFISATIIYILIFGIVGYFTSHSLKADIKQANGTAYEAILPFKSKNAGEIGKYSYTIKIKAHPLMSGNFQIIADDCIDDIWVNGKKLHGLINKEKACDTKNGIDIHIGKYLYLGANEITVDTYNTGGQFGLQFVDTSFYTGYQIFIPLLCCFVFLLFKVPCKKFISNKINLITMKKTWIINSVPFFTLIFLYVVGMFIKDNSAYRWIFIWGVAGSVALPCFYSIYRKSISPKFTLCILFICLALCASFISYHFYDEYSYDVEGHIQYIQYIIEAGHSPNPAGGWLFYHPSLYYRSAAIFWQIANYNRNLNYEEFLKLMQGFTFTLFILYCYFSIRTIDSFYEAISQKNEKNRRSNSYRLTVVLFLLWPANSIFSGRIGNDIMFELLYAITFYAIVKWWLSQKISHFLLILICSSLAVWTKSNGFILFGVIGTLLPIGYILDKSKVKNRWYLQKTVALTTFLLVITYLAASDKFSRGYTIPDTPLIVSNAAGLGQELRIENNFGTYLTFDPVKFVCIPYTSAIDPLRGRDNFWHFLLKTSLVGEFTEGSPILGVVASILSLLLLFLLPIFFTGLVFSLKSSRTGLPIIASILLLVTSMIIFRLSYPFSCSNDFRYIYPAILPFCMLVGRGHDFLKGWWRWKEFSMGSVIIFTLTATLYQILNILKY